MARDLNARITVDLNPFNPAQNIFNYQKLISSPEKKESPKRTRKVFNEYDLEDGFIDDQVEYEVDGNFTWDFGFFAWKGSLEELFDNPERAKLDQAEPIVNIDLVNLKNPKKEEIQETAASDMEEVAKADKIEPKPKKKKKVTPGTPSKPKSEAKIKDLPSTPSKKTKIPIQIEPEKTIFNVPESVQKQLDALQAEAKKSDFTIKKQFPPNLKPIFVDCINAALDVGIYEKPFYETISTILPYNTFTMQKLATKIAFPDRITRIKQELQTSYDSMQKLVVEHFEPVL